MEKHGITIGHSYYVECYDNDGNLKWTDGFKNLITTVGRNHYLDSTLKNSASAAWYVGLKGTGTISASDTMASHAGWTEFTGYTGSTRPTYTLGTASNGSIDNSASKATYNINTSSTVAGSFIVDNSTKSGTTGILLGVGDFTASRSVISGDTITVTTTISATSS